MDDLWDIKVFRKNLMLVSIITIIIFIFWWNIKEINIFWMIKLENINSYKILILILVTNIYVLVRYGQYLLKHDLNINYKILILEVINNKYFQKNIIEIREMTRENDYDWTSMYTKKTYKKNEITNLSYNKSVQLSYNNWNATRIFCYNALTDENIIWWLFGVLENNNMWLYLNNNNKGRDDDNLYIEYKENKLIFFILKIKFYIKEHIFFDYYLPIIFWVISIILIVINTTYLIIK